MPRVRRRSSASTTLSCSSTGNLAGAVAARAAAEGLEAAVFVPADLEPEKLAAAAVYGPTHLCGQRHVRPLLPALGGAVVRAAVGIRQRQPALVLRRGLEDTRIRGRRAARLGRRLTSSRSRSPRARSSTRSDRDSGSCARSASSTARRRARRRPGGGLPPGRDRLRDGRARHAGAAGHGRALARDREPGRRRLRRRRPPAPPAERSTPWRRRTIGENMALLAADDRRVRRDGDRRHARRAARRDRRRRARRALPRVVLLVTGDGLKTPQPGRAHVRSVRDRGGRGRVRRRRC